MSRESWAALKFGMRMGCNALMWPVWLHLVLAALCVTQEWQCAPMPWWWHLGNSGVMVGHVAAIILKPGWGFPPVFFEAVAASVHEFAAGSRR